MSTKKPFVCINVFPSLDYIEIVKLEEQGGEVECASALPIVFDLNTRTIEDVEVLSQTIRDLYDTNRIPLNSHTILILPSIYTRETELPGEFSDDEIETALISEAEQFYIFNKSEPQVDYFPLENNLTLYSAYQKTEAEKYLEIFQEHRIPLIAIDINYFSILRGLIVTGAIADEIHTNQEWCLLNVTNYAFFGIVCRGLTIIKTIESPLSIGADGTSSADEIQQDYERFSEGMQLSKIILVNDSTRTTTEDLMSKVGFQSQVMIIEQSATTLKSRGAQDGIFPCSLQAIGGAVYNQVPDVPTLNLKPQGEIDIVKVMDWQRKAKIGMVGLCVLCLLGGVMTWGVLGLMIMLNDAEIHSIGENIKKAGQLEIGTNSLADVKKKIFIKKAVEKNILANDTIIKAATSLPENIWFTRIELEKNEQTGNHFVQIAGSSLSSENVGKFLNSLNTELPHAKFEVNDVNLSSTPDGEEFYQWEIETK